jgi:hypothetical protein
MQHVKVLYYQKWKRIALADLGPDRITSKLSEIITSSDEFNRCVENDYYLLEILNEKLLKIIQGLVTSDMLLYCNEVQPTMKTYRNGEQVNLIVQALLTNSIVGQLL